jgi:TetR/AcrR family transcriptional repressor of mexJK operon
MHGKKKKQAVGVRWGKTPASQRRRQDIVAAAKAVFFKEGYQLASMDRIASAAGTTKRTLYDHFGTKEALFSECIRYGCQLFVRSLPQPEELSEDIASALTQFIGGLASLLNAPDTIRFLRMVIGEAERHPDFGRILQEEAFTPAAQTLRTFLDRQITTGNLRPHDTGLWAQILVGLAATFEHTQALLGAGNTGCESRSQQARAQSIASYVRDHKISRSPHRTPQPRSVPRPRNE